MNPVARLFGSLANALLDLGLPTIRQWLRDRIGPAADVAQVTTDGSLVHLDGVKIPIGPNGLLVLERASAAITALGERGLPEVRLHAFNGAIGFGDAAHWFRADVSFTTSPEPDEAAWIAGELAIWNATWSAREGSTSPKPMAGHARLFVSSSEWRIEGGRLEGEVFRGRFAGTGVFEPAASEAVQEHEQPLVPPALSTAALSLERARVGPFLDAVAGLGGKGIAIPSFIPLDAELDGELSWSLADGGRAELRVASEAIRATLRGGVGPTGRALAGRIDAHVRPATLLRGSGVPHEAMPREEDTLAVALEIGGELRSPVVKGTLGGTELGFRLGRPRFVPPVVLREPHCEMFLANERAVVRAAALARSANVTLDLDVNIRDLGSARGCLRADRIEAAFLRDIVRTLGATSVVPEQAIGSIDFTLQPSDVRPITRSADGGSTAPAQSLEARARQLSGAVTLTASSSKLAFEVLPNGAMRLAGVVSAADVIATGAFGTRAVAPIEGNLIVALDVLRHPGGALLRGTASARRLALALRHRPEVPPYVLEDAAVSVTLDRERLTYEELRFRAHGGRFVARGTIPFVVAPSSVLVDLQLEEGGAELAEALAQLANAPGRGTAGHGHDAASADGGRAPDAMHGGSRRLRFRRAQDRSRPADELWLPRELEGRGRLQLSADGTLVADVTVETANGTALHLALVLSNGGDLDGTTLDGSISVTDLIVSGALGPRAPERCEPDDRIEVDALVGARSDEGNPWLVALWSGRLSLDYATTLLVVSQLQGALRVDAAGIAWRDVRLEVCGGSIASSGIANREEVRARVSFSQVAVHDLPPVRIGAGASAAGSAREVTAGDFVRGRLSGSVIARIRGMSLHAAGDVMLEDAAFPALELVRPALARYGLRPPNEDAVLPATASIVGTDWGIFARDVKIDLHGANLRGEIGLSRERMLDGRAEVVLEEEYLRTSKLLTLPRVLTDRLVVPLRIEGALERPRVEAGIAELLGRFLKDNRVSSFVTSAVEEAQLLLGRHPIREHEPVPDRPPHDKELDALLRHALDAHAADWEALAGRQAARAARLRIG